MKMKMGVIKVMYDASTESLMLYAAVGAGAGALTLVKCRKYGPHTSIFRLLTDSIPLLLFLVVVLLPLPATLAV